MGNMFSGRPSHATGDGDLSVRHYNELCLSTIRALGFESFSFVLHSISQLGIPKLYEQCDFRPLYLYLVYLQAIFS